MPDCFADLNPQQRAAVDHGLPDLTDRAGHPAPPPSPPLLVIAGAGSGKTMTLAARVARLVLAGADPQRLLLLTFSRRAAQEMERRAGHLLRQALGLPPHRPAPTLPWSGTFHAVGARLLRDYAGRIGLAPSFTVLDRGDTEDLLGLVRQELGLAATRERFPAKGTCLAIYSRVVNSQQPLKDVLAESFPWCLACEAALARLFGAFVAEKQRQQVLDYDDLLLYWWHLLAEPALAAQVGARFDHVLVDEYQDTNRLQAEILRALKPDGRGLTVVGDDAQAIYAFRAAEVRNILDFPAQFAPAARVVTLERNYRSTQPLLAASNAVISAAPERHAKVMWTDRTSAEPPALVTVEDDAAQARWVADDILAHREEGLALKSQAVLFRASHHSAMLELELARRNIPFVKFGGLKFLEAAHVKDLLAVLRWADNPHGRLAGFRVAQLLPGMGPAHARRLLDSVQANVQTSVHTSGRDFIATLAAFKPPAAAAAPWAALVDLMTALQSAHAGWPADVELAMRWYAPHMERLHDHPQTRLGDLAQLARMAAGHATRERFLTEMTLDPPSATSDHSGPPHLDEDYVILSTIHSAKGQEWSSVHVLNVVDGCIPSDITTGGAKLIEEERRLLYVAMTRARQHLRLMVPQRFYVTQQGAFGDRHVYGGLTRFITPDIERCFERLGPLRGDMPAEVPAQASVPDPSLTASRWPTVPAWDVKERLRAAWR